MATREGLQAKSFALAAESYREAVGGSMSPDSLRRLTEGWGQVVAERRADEAQHANAPVAVGESPRTRRVVEVDPIAAQASVSTDGAMLLIRTEGWKEVKIAAISEVRTADADARIPDPAQPSRRDHDVLVTLGRHSYQAGLWDADTFAPYQYAEGLRRGLDHCQQVTSTNDGAPWIDRVTRLNFPEAPQIIDWSHAAEHVWAVAHAVQGEHTPAAQRWAETQLEALWEGHVAEVVQTLDRLHLDQESYPPLVQQAPDYFRTRQKQMQYDQFRTKGWPIGSGVVESAANTVVQHRLKRPGRGWKREYAQAMLAALCELHSHRFERVWQA
ncbi:MAG: hypothetical protein HY870_08295 [Chloroflexi bacterium]|nr:hypothetical protein [Chloroflexota bacterium]